VEADCVQNEDQNFVFKILELATEKLYMGRGRLCGKRVMGGDWRQQQRLGDDHQRSCRVRNGYLPAELDR
jgi:hypothetical protein